MLVVEFVDRLDYDRNKHEYSMNEEKETKAWVKSSSK